MFTGDPLADEEHSTFATVNSVGVAGKRHGLLGVVESDAEAGSAREQIRVLPDADEPSEEFTVSRDQLGEVFVVAEPSPLPVSREFPVPAAFGDRLQPAVSSDAAAGLKGALEAAAPQDWQQLRLEATALGNRLELAVRVITEHGEQSWVPPVEVLQWLRRHRQQLSTPDGGAWTSASVQLVWNGPAAELELNYDEPQWRVDREAGPERFREYYEELRLLPRDRSAPGWLLERAWEYHAVALEAAVKGERTALPGKRELRVAEVFDGLDEQGKPEVYRVALPWSEKLPVFEYLRGGHFVLGAQSTSQDIVDSARAPQVPNRFVTDGEFIWPAAMAYYLDVHNITPPVEFLEHIRRRRYCMPEVVPDEVIRGAEAQILGTDLAELPAGHAAEAMELVLDRIADLRVSKQFYSFEAAVEGGWSMLREADGWWSVFCTEDGARKNEVRFHEVYDAGAHLVGCLALTQDRLRRPADEALADYECPVRPIPGEPPLESYEAKTLVELVPGDEVDRFGSSSGNTVFVAGTTIPQRSFPRGQNPGEYHRYRVRVGFQVVTGTIKPENGQVGGGQAYVLPQSVQDLLAGGWFKEIS